MFPRRKGDRYVFQFHKGTIKTHIDMLDKSPCYRGFPNAKIRKKTGEICRCGIKLKD